MGLMDEIQADAGRRRHLLCHVEKAAAALSPDEAADLDAALADDSIPATAISRVLEARGLHVRPASVQRHRRGECACPR